MIEYQIPDEYFFRLHRALGNAIPPVLFWYVANAVKENLSTI